MKRVAHFIPAYRRQVDIDVAMSIARDGAWCAAVKWQHMPFYVDATGIARARNQAVREAIEHDADLLLMQDADCFALPPYTFSALEVMYRNMAKVSAAVVGAAVKIRHGEAMNCSPARPGEFYPGEVGTGLMLINLRQLAKLPRPWFVEDVDADGETRLVGEDIAFCRRVRKELGLGVWVDFTFPTAHAHASLAPSMPPPAAP